MKDTALLGVTTNQMARAVTANLGNLNQEELDMPVTRQDFIDAVSKCNKSVSKEDLDKYEKWMEEFGSA